MVYAGLFFFLICSTFFIITNLLLYVRTKMFILKHRNVSFNAHDLKCNVNLLTHDQIFFCLADKENHKFKDQRFNCL